MDSVPKARQKRDDLENDRFGGKSATTDSIVMITDNFV